jgi:hypothetical protein
MIQKSSLPANLRFASKALTADGPGEGDGVLLEGVFGEARPPVGEVDIVVTLVDAVSVAGLALETRDAGLTSVTLGDAHLPRDVTSAVSHAGRLVDDLVSSSYALRPPSRARASIP